MAETPLFLNTLSTERYLMSASPEAVFNWFMASVAELKGNFDLHSATCSKRS